MKAQWNSEKRAISTETELHVLVAEIRAQGQPTMAFFEHENGCSLVVGIGAKESVLTFADEYERTYHSVGDKNRMGMLVFSCRGQLDEFFEEMAVPEQLAISAALEFLKSGNRPTGIEWEPDW